MTIEDADYLYQFVIDITCKLVNLKGIGVQPTDIYISENIFPSGMKKFHGINLHCVNNMYDEDGNPVSYVFSCRE